LLRNIPQVSAVLANSLRPLLDDPIEIPNAVKKQLLDPSSIPREIKLAGRAYYPQTAAGDGYKAVVWKVLDEFGRARALKLATYQDYIDRSWVGELEHAAPLERYPVFARIDHGGRTTLTLQDGGVFDAVYFLEEWVEGVTLRKFIADRSGEVDAAFLLSYAEHMTRALGALNAHGLEHDDLHDGNVMLADPAPGDDGNMQVRIIDMGSLKPRDRVSKKIHDLDRFADHLIAIHNVIIRGRRASHEERRFLSEVYEVPLKRMADPDATVALRDPKLIREALQNARSRVRDIGEPKVDRPLTSPFEFISSEHISDDRTFVKLFAEAPWLSKIASRDSCLVTGPRGCGKSTLFRWLSLRTQLSREEPELERFPIAGFYLSCSTELEGRFAWLTDVDSVTEWKDELIHFFNLLLAREVVDTLLLMREQEVTDSKWQIGENEENRVLEFLQHQIGENVMGIVGASTLNQALALIERERYRCDFAMRRLEHLPATTPAVFINDFCRLLVEAIPFFAHHRITFLIDDYTRRRVDAHVQRALNGIIWSRPEHHLFKVSSEKGGVDLNDLTGKPIDAAREMVPVDIGREYLSLSDHAELERARNFAIELLDARLNAAGYQAKAVDLLGHSDWGRHGTLARALRDAPQERSQYHGIECIADLCSGDVATLLLVYRRIFEEGRVTRDTKTNIAPAKQHRAIRKASGEQVDMLRDHFPCGSEIHEVVNQFGTFVAEVLRKGRAIKKGDTAVPPAMPRIEVDDTGQIGEQLEGETRALYDELVRRAVFIEMEPSRSRHGHVQTLRWQLRRVYLPNFGAALTKSVALKIGPADFKYLLEDPVNACKKFWRKEQKEPGVEGFEQKTLEEDSGD